MNGSWVLRWRLLGLGALSLIALIVTGCMDPPEEVPEVKEGEPAAEEGNAPPAKGGAAQGAAGDKELPTKTPREEGAVKDGRPAPPKYPTATWVPGKPGFCLNPFNNNEVDCRGIPPGTLVQDPLDQTKTQRFRVPKLPEE